MPLKLSPVLNERSKRRDAVAEGLERESLRYLPFCADRVAFEIAPNPGQKLLEVFAGVGNFALAASQAVGPSGRVTAIDVSEKLLDRLTAKIVKFGISNIDVHFMGAAPLDFRRDYFHHVVCILGLDACPDPAMALRSWHRVLLPGGQLTLAAFNSTAFEPGAGLLCKQIADLGIVLPESAKSFRADPESLRGLLEGAGFSQVSIKSEKLGYHLPDTESWWEVVLYGPLRRWLEPLSDAQREVLRAAHLDSVAGLMTADGLWLDTSVHLVRAEKSRDR